MRNFIRERHDQMAREEETLLSELTEMAKLNAEWLGRFDSSMHAGMLKMLVQLILLEMEER